MGVLKKILGGPNGKSDGKTALTIKFLFSKGLVGFPFILIEIPSSDCSKTSNPSKALIFATSFIYKEEI